jgi:hypothetical protein
MLTTNFFCMSCILVIFGRNDIHRHAAKVSTGEFSQRSPQRSMYTINDHSISYPGYILSMGLNLYMEIITGNTGLSIIAK